MKKIVWVILTSFALTGIVNAKNQFSATINPIPPAIQTKMLGVSYHPGCPIGFDQLSYLQLSYWGFDDKVHTGELIVNQKIAVEVVAIFKELFDDHFQIENMALPEDIAATNNSFSETEVKQYNRLDNSYAFFCRNDPQSPKQLSMHSYGYAIDLNPVYNPAILIDNHNQVQPDLGKPFLNRSIQHMGMIKEGDATFNTFLKHGWEWGGFFLGGADYMHFQKAISAHYLSNKLELIPASERILNLPN